jgi:hypothetical protein
MRLVANSPVLYENEDWVDMWLFTMICMVMGCNRDTAKKQLMESPYDYHGMFGPMKEINQLGLLIQPF